MQTVTSFPCPRVRMRKGNFPYIFIDPQDFTQATDWRLDKAFNAQWLTISCDGLITVKANSSGYAWDGCSPKFDIFNLLVIGTPDGHIDYRTNRPYTYRASMVHDALYQYLDSIPISKREVDRLFLQMLGDFKLRHAYHFFVTYFGGRGVKQRGLSAPRIKPAATQPALSKQRKAA
ncbi:MAG: DUF1353 domain-containing protein [Pseudomonadaceae bacterium]|jgi:hypothetical protein|nr:DUF1353 domain-containing protein [Pseudomonadaceae bacterium]